MTPKDWITLGIAIWGALLSTGIAIYEVIKDRRRLYLTWDMEPDQSMYLIVVNISHHPITVSELGVGRLIRQGRKRYWDDYESYVVYTNIEPSRVFPKTLNQGDKFKLELPEDIWTGIRESNVMKIRFTASDVEGRKYSSIEHRDPPR